MILPKIGRKAMIKGVSALGVAALVSIGMAGLQEQEPESMREMSDAALITMMDVTLEEPLREHTRRALAEYRSSKGLFSCEGECVDKKRRYLEAERHLALSTQQRAAARREERKRARGAGGSAADRLAAAKAKAAARAAARRAAAGGGTSVLTGAGGGLSPRAAAQARAAARKAQRAAERAARNAAAGGSSSGGGGGMTPAQRRAARQAERRNAAAAARAAAAAAAEAERARIEAKTAADYFEASREIFDEDLLKCVTIGQERDVDAEAEVKRTQLTEAELFEYESLIVDLPDWVLQLENPFGFDGLAKIAVAKEHADNPTTCTDMNHIDFINYFIKTLLYGDDELGWGPETDMMETQEWTFGVNFLDQGSYNVHSWDLEVHELEEELGFNYVRRCQAVEVFKHLRDRQNAGEDLNELVQYARSAMEEARDAYAAAVEAAQPCKEDIGRWWQGYMPEEPTWQEADQHCLDKFGYGDFDTAAARRLHYSSPGDLDPYKSYAGHVDLSITMMDEPFSDMTLAKVKEAVYRYNHPNSALDIVRFLLLDFKLSNGGFDFFFLDSFNTTGIPELEALEERLQITDVQLCAASISYQYNWQNYGIGWYYDNKMWEWTELVSEMKHTPLIWEAFKQTPAGQEFADHVSANSEIQPENL